MDSSIRRSKPQLRKKRETSSDEEGEAKKPTPVVATAKKPAVQKGLQIGAVGTIKADKKLLSKGLSFGDEDDSAEFSKKQSVKVKQEIAGKGPHTFGKNTDKPAPVARGSYYSSTSYSSDELAALTKNAKSLGAGSIIRMPTNTSGCQRISFLDVVIDAIHPAHCKLTFSLLYARSVFQRGRYAVEEAQGQVRKRRRRTRQDQGPPVGQQIRPRRPRPRRRGGRGG